jgi:hypothetical protein
MKQPPTDYQGLVSGIDVIQHADRTQCFAFINRPNQEGEYIQVSTINHHLQTALETASLKNVEITDDDLLGTNELTRVRILDR